MLLAMLPLVSAAVQEATSKARKPMPIASGSWRSDNDYPSGPLRRGEMGTVQIELDVDARGRVAGCHVTGSSGYWDLDEPVCPMLAKQLAFKPALDAAGVPAASQFTTRFDWRIPGKTGGVFSRTGGSAQPIELSLTVAQLPADYRRPALLRLRVASGKSVNCRLERSSGSAGVDAAACSQARQQVSQPTAATGAPMDAVTVTATFQKDPAP